MLNDNAVGRTLILLESVFFMETSYMNKPVASRQDSWIVLVFAFIESTQLESTTFTLFKGSPSASADILVNNSQQSLIPNQNNWVAISERTEMLNFRV